MIQEPAGASHPTDIIPGEPVTVWVTPTHVLTLTSSHIVHHVQVIVLGDVAAAGGEHPALVRYRGGGGGGGVLRYVIVLSVIIPALTLTVVVVVDVCVVVVMSKQVSTS